MDNVFGSSLARSVGRVSGFGFLAIGRLFTRSLARSLDANRSVLEARASTLLQLIENRIEKRTHDRTLSLTKKKHTHTHILTQRNSTIRCMRTR